MGLSIYHEFLKSFGLWRCTQCNQILDRTEFYSSKYHALYSSCKRCFYKLGKSYQKKYAPIFSANNHFLRMLVLAHYSDGYLACACCGIDVPEFLVLDHINGGGNQQRKLLKVNSGTTFYRWLLKNQCPDGYQVLCWHCNVSKWNRGQCEIDHKEMKY